jgi:hypothetical protein
MITLGLVKIEKTYLVSIEKNGNKIVAVLSAKSMDQAQADIDKLAHCLAEIVDEIVGQ